MARGRAVAVDGNDGAVVDDGDGVRCVGLLSRQ